MIAPSPDWFTGVRNVSLVDGNGDFITTPIVVNSFSYDSGTDDGEGFTSDDAISNPVQNIFRLDADAAPTPFAPGDVEASIGTFTFQIVE